MSRYAFARRPKWLFGHFLVLVVVVTFVNLGLWQLRRLHERRSFNAVVEQNMDAPVAPLGEVLTAQQQPAAVDAVLDRRVRAHGHYLVDDEVLIDGQSFNGQPGAWVVTPLAQDDGSVVLVNRGWISDNGALSKVPADARPPTGPVTVEGLITRTQTARALERQDPATGKLASLARVDVARIARQLARPTVPAFIQRTVQSPADGGSIQPVTLPPPELDEGPHLNYAFQWFSFTTLTLIGYPLLLRKVARDEERKAAGGGPSSLPDLDDLPEGAVIDADGTIDLTGVAPADRPAR